MVPLNCTISVGVARSETQCSVPANPPPLGTADTSAGPSLGEGTLLSAQPWDGSEYLSALLLFALGRCH